MTTEEKVNEAGVLVLLAHPTLQTSWVNRRLMGEAEAMDGVSVHDLYQQYPDFDVVVEQEQSLLEASHTVVMQFPFFWYSTPSLLKEWQDLVLTHGWAYGHSGDRLHGKALLCVVSTGAQEAAYQTGGFNRYTMGELLRPLELTARLCGMSWLPPFVVHGTHALSDDALDRRAADYRELLAGLVAATGED